MHFCELIEALQQQGFVVEASGESPTTWRIVPPFYAGRPYPIVEAFQLSVPFFAEDYEYDWSDGENTLIVRER
jgi:hypothetical protein